MVIHLSSAGLYLLAACLEIAGCFAFWAWLRNGRSAVWTLAGLASLVLFALCLTRIESAYAGRAFAAYGGVYITASLLWLLAVEGTSPDRWDVLGAVICLIGSAVILWGPR
jgi:small multidrug resistance family-3 protein